MKKTINILIVGFIVGAIYAFTPMSKSTSCTKVQIDSVISVTRHNTELINENNKNIIHYLKSKNQ